MTDQEITQLVLIAQQVTNMQGDITLMKGEVSKAFQRVHERVDDNARWILRMQGVVGLLSLLVIPVIVAVIIRWLATV